MEFLTLFDSSAHFLIPSLIIHLLPFITDPRALWFLLHPFTCTTSTLSFDARFFARHFRRFRLQAGLLGYPVMQISWGTVELLSSYYMRLLFLHGEIEGGII